MPADEVGSVKSRGTLTNESCLLRHTRGRQYTEASPGASTGYCLFLAWPRSRLREERPAPGSNLDAHQTVGMDDRLVRMLLSFQRPSRPEASGDSSGSTQPGGSQAGSGL